MASFVVNFAQLNIGIDSKFDYTYKFCKEYLTDNEADFRVSASEDEIKREMEDSPYNPLPPYAESICIYREIADRLPEYDRCVFHGAVISYEGRGYLFTAPSGTGKTTHIRLWQKYLDGVEIVNGDKPILHITEDSVYAYATPYAGKEGYQNKKSIKLSGICLVEQAKENSIKRLNASECLLRIITQIYRPYDSAGVSKTLELLDNMLKAVPVFSLGCDISEDAVKCSYEALVGKEYNGKNYED
ncbi:MAG: hypothetical protein IJS03_03365 [Eubacterium sp.]|nr:hypothetical protein [Eubacterium sp.]